MILYKVKEPIFVEMGSSTVVEGPSYSWRLFDKDIFGGHVHKDQKRWCVIEEKLVRPFEFGRAGPGYIRSFETKEQAVEHIKAAFNWVATIWFEEVVIK